jgi:hypothetical protein
MSETTAETEPLTLVEQREVAFRAMRDKANVALREGAPFVAVNPADLIGLYAALESYRETALSGPGRTPQVRLVQDAARPAPAANADPGPVTVGRLGEGAMVNPQEVLILDGPNGDHELWDVRPGDILHLALLIADVDSDLGAIVDVPKTWGVFRPGTYEIPLTEATSITRPPLPTAPGSRGDAKVRGKLRTTVVRAGNPVGHQQWMSATPVAGESWHADCDITEYVPEGER